MWTVLGVIVIISYDTWIAAPWVNGHPKIFNGYLSELAASDQPNNLFFRAGDLISAVIVAAIAVAAWIRWPTMATRGGWRARAWARVSAGFLLLFALATAADSFSSMDCSPTLSHACRAAERAGELSFAHYLHTETSVAAQTGIVGSMIAALLIGRYVPISRRWLWALCVVEVIALAVLLIMLDGDMPGLSYPQAVTTLAGAIWFCVAAFSLREHPHDSGGEER